MAVCALAYAAHALLREKDPTFAAIWLLWAVLWGLFFVLLARPLGTRLTPRPSPESQRSVRHA